MEEAFRRKVLGRIYGDYGGLPETSVHQLCLLLDEERDAGTSWIQLAEELFSPSCSLIEAARRKYYNGGSPTKDVLKIYFSRKRKGGVSDEDAVQCLLEVFEVLNIGQAVRILRNVIDGPGT